MLYHHVPWMPGTMLQNLLFSLLSSSLVLVPDLISYAFIPHFEMRLYNIFYNCMLIASNSLPVLQGVTDKSFH